MHLKMIFYINKIIKCKKNTIFTPLCGAAAKFLEYQPRRQFFQKQRKSDSTFFISGSIFGHWSQAADLPLIDYNMWLILLSVIQLSGGHCS